MAETVDTHENARGEPVSDRNTTGRGGPSADSAGVKAKAVYPKVNRPVFITSAVLIVGFALWAWLFPSQAETVIFDSMDWIATNLGWYYVLTATIIVVFVLVVAFTKVGNVRMGPDHSKPKFNMFTWASMLFAAGIGVDLMFFGIAGPATNILTPPEGASMSDEAARMAPLWTMFHYGIPGWAMYGLMGMAVGIFAYRYHMPLSIRSVLAPIFGKRVHGVPGHTVQVAAVLGTIFGISVSLGIGVVFLNYGLSYIFGIPNNLSIQIALMAAAVGITVISTVTGVDKGIRRLSELNVLLCIVLILFVLFTGDTAQLLNQLVQNIGDFASRFPSMMMNTFGYTTGLPEYPSGDWQKDWTLFFWAWWIAWAAFVGLFLARISRGRTLRQFVLGVLLIPFSFVLLWISIFGNAAIALFRAGDEEFLDLAISLPESGFYNLLTNSPGATFSIGLAVVAGLLFYVTSADSGSLVMANLTSDAPEKGGSPDGAPWLRIFWAVVTGVLTLAMLFIDGVYTLQAATVIIGLPFSIVMYLVMISLWKVLKAESRNMDSQRATFPGVLSSRTGDRGDTRNWRQRLWRRMNYADAAQAAAFVEEVATPAVEEVADELRTLGADVACQRGEHPAYPIPYVDLVVRIADQSEFKYQAYPVAYNVPNYAVNPGAVEEVFFKIEIFSITGSQGKDIMGFTKEQVISDILDSYDAHVMYMSMLGDKGAPTSALPAEIPDEWEDTDRARSENA